MTQTDFPADFDLCWEMANVDLQTLYIVEPVLFDFRNRRGAQKVKFLGGIVSVAATCRQRWNNLFGVLPNRQELGPAKRDRRRRSRESPMIRNERQYKITKSQAEGFRKAHDQLQGEAGAGYLRSPEYLRLENLNGTLSLESVGRSHGRPQGI